MSLHCSIHGEKLQLFCEECGPLAVEKSRTSVGYALWQSLSPQIGAEAATAEIERRVQVRVVRVWAEGAYGQIQTRLDNGPWTGGVGNDEEGDPQDVYKFSQRVEVQAERMA